MLTLLARTQDGWRVVDGLEGLKTFQPVVVADRENVWAGYVMGGCGLVTSEGRLEGFRVVKKLTMSQWLDTKEAGRTK